MNYYKARTIETLPKLIFDYVASSIEELEAMGLQDSPIVVEEARLTDTEHEEFISYEFGVCHLRNVDGALVARPQSEIDDAKAVFEAGTSVQKTKAVQERLEFETFSFDALQFPITPGAVLVYQAIFESEAANRIIASTTGNYTLNIESIPSFKTAFYNRLIAINSDEVENEPTP